MNLSKFMKGKPLVRKTAPQKAYHNLDFLNGPSARPIRLLSELLEPQQQLRQEGVKDTIVFFGSARFKSKLQSSKLLKNLTLKLKKSKGKHHNNQQLVEDAKADYQMSKYYEDAVQLSKKLTQWTQTLQQPFRFVICSGGGPGIMEAANKGAALAKGRSIGFNVSLPFEQFANPYVTPDLNFEFHYFFMRKFWFVYLAKAFVMFPGGFGTMDELMEVLTLVQTQKLRKKVTILLYGKEFWNEVLNFDALIKHRVISPDDLKLFRIVDTPEEAFSHLVKELHLNYPLETASS
jgi:uncharacterized protein (TIGR00730 family)